MRTCCGEVLEHDALECPYCGRIVPEMPEDRDEYPNAEDDDE